MRRGFIPLETIGRHRRALMSVTGFTLIEILFAFSILVFCLCGILLTYINMFILTDLSRDLTSATNVVQAKLEEAKKTTFSELTSESFNLTNYGFPYADSIGGFNVTDVSADYNYTTGSLKRVKVTACFKSRGRLIGSSITDCTNSPVEAVTLIAP